MLHRQILFPSKPGLRIEPGLECVLNDLLRFTLIQNLEIVRQPNQTWSLGDDISRQTVKSSHPVLRSKALIAKKLTNLLLKLAPGRVDQCHNQNLLTSFERSVTNQFRRQQ